MALLAGFGSAGEEERGAPIWGQRVPLSPGSGPPLSSSLIPFVWFPLLLFFPGQLFFARKEPALGCSLGGCGGLPYHDALSSRIPEDRCPKSPLCHPVVRQLPNLRLCSSDSGRPSPLSIIGGKDSGFEIRDVSSNMAGRCFPPEGLGFLSRTAWPMLRLAGLGT